MEIRCSDQTAGLAQVRVITTSPSEIRGILRGPFCSYARTLPATYPLEQGVARVVDPCYWTPHMPFRYEVKLTVAYENGEQRQEEFLWGLRWCVPHKRDLRLNGKRYVVRGIASQRDDVDLQELHQLSSALVTPVVDAKFLDKASEVGVCIVLDATAQDAEALPACHRFPAVHFMKDGPKGIGDVLCVSSHQDLSAELHWMRDTGMSTDPARSKPVFVARQTGTSTLADMRRECDALQKDLAPWGQFAGYIMQSTSSS